MQVLCGNEDRKATSTTSGRGGKLRGLFLKKAQLLEWRRQKRLQKWQRVQALEVVVLFFLLVCFILLLTAQATKDDDNQTNAVTGCSASFLLTCRPGPHCFATQHQHPAASRLNARCNATRAIRPCEPRTAGRRLFATGVAAAAAQRSKHAFRLRHPFILPRLAAQPKKCNARYPCDT